MLVTCSRLLFVALVLAASGCAICASCDDYTYPTEGGVWQRLDPVYGRVGSVFTPEVWTVEGSYHDGSVIEEMPATLAPEMAAPESLPPADEAAPEPPDQAASPETSVLQVPYLRTR